MSVLLLAAVAAVVFLAATVTTIAGFGFSLMAVPLLSAMLGGRDAVAVASLVGLISTTVVFVTGRGSVDRGVVLRQLSAAAVGMPLGLAVLLVLDDRLMRLVIAAAVLVAVALLARGLQIRRGGALLDVGAGFLSGVLNTSVGTGGPPLVFANQARGLDPATTRATLSAVFTGSALVANPLFLAAGRYTGEVLLAAGSAVPALAVGWVVGVRIHRSIDARRFRGLVLVLLVASALVAAASALG